MRAYLKKGETFVEVAAEFGVGAATARRYVNETVELLAARAPGAEAGGPGRREEGYAYLVLDGTLIPIDRVVADRPFYSGKHKKHGVNLQVIACPDRDILWVSGALPGSVHDRGPRGSEACWMSWKPRAWSPWRTRDTREAATR